jgi:hypothetical protein
MKDGEDDEMMMMMMMMMMNLGTFDGVARRLCQTRSVPCVGKMLFCVCGLAWLSHTTPTSTPTPSFTSRPPSSFSRSFT